MIYNKITKMLLFSCSIFLKNKHNRTLNNIKWIYKMKKNTFIKRINSVSRLYKQPYTQKTAKNSTLKNDLRQLVLHTPKA